MGFFERLKDGLQKTRKNFTERIEVYGKGVARWDFLND